MDKLSAKDRLFGGNDSTTLCRQFFICGSGMQSESHIPAIQAEKNFFGSI
jgi:hypothetical protein